MNIGRLFFELFKRWGIGRWSRLKKMIIGIAGIISILFFFIIFSNQQTNKNSSLPKVTLMPQKAKPKKELNYEFIKLDTIKIPNFPRAAKPVAETLKKVEPYHLEPLPLAENTNQSALEPQQLKKSVKSKISSKVKSMLPKKSASYKTKPASKNPNMIVTNNLAANPVHSGSSPTAFAGMQSALIKLVLPNRTPVANGSLVEARVLRDSKWGSMFIPRRTKLIGVASLFNRRVNIDFREIIINNMSRSCSGRAYDLKRLQGLPYSPVNSATKRALLEELRDAVSGIPVVGRVANRATLTRNYTQDVSELEEGLEFYALINSIL